MLKRFYPKDGVYISIKFDAVWQGIEFTFGFGKNIEIIEPTEAIFEIKKKALEMIDLYQNPFKVYHYRDKLHIIQII
ncbi:hypothetical protein [Clostridium thermarum]|uniref:hypothetical protein n=1 Tax=Clostridium thermarum TaxID=1716543 RepID=UPI001FABDEE8|nr:hypothetical protein [Clostridium thermarum]